MDHEEAVEKKLEANLGVDRAKLLKRVAVGGAALSLPAFLSAQEALAAPSRSGRSSAGGGGNYPNHPKWKFAFINHVTTNPFFVPTQYGAVGRQRARQRATYTWTRLDEGRRRRDDQRLQRGDQRQGGRHRRLRRRQGRFEAPIKRALGKGIPVVAYNADGASGGPKARMAYIGQALYDSGFAMGERIATLVPEGRRRHLHRHAGRAQHPAAHRRCARRDQAVRQADQRRRRSRPTPT